VIHQALLSQFSLLAEFIIEKLLVKDRDSRVLKLVNLKPVRPKNILNKNIFLNKYMIIIFFKAPFDSRWGCCVFVCLTGSRKAFQKLTTAYTI
jgi:hypothetical protein